MTSQEFIDKWFPLPKSYNKDKNFKQWDREEAKKNLDDLLKNNIDDFVKWYNNLWFQGIDKEEVKRYFKEEK